MDAETTAIQLPPDLSRLTELLQHHVEKLIQGSEDVRAAAVQATKYIFDLALSSEPGAVSQVNELLQSLAPSYAPQTRSQSLAKKRRRSPSPLLNVPHFQTTPLPCLVTAGMDEHQIWTQLELRAKNVCSVLEQIIEETMEEDDLAGDEPPQKRTKAEMDLDSNDASSDSDDDLYEDTGDDEGEHAGVDFGGQADSDSELSDEPLAERISDLRDPSPGAGDEEGENGRPSKSSRISTTGLGRTKLSRGSHPDLDDGFFDLASFNAETEAADALTVTSGRLAGSDDESEVDLGIDLFVEVTGDDIDGTDKELMYKDFFGPPSHIARPSSRGGKPTAARSHDSKVRFSEQVKIKSIEARGNSRPVSSMGIFDRDDDEEEDVDDETDDNIEEGENSGSDGMSASREDLDARNLEDGWGTLNQFKDDLFAEDSSGDESDRGQTNHERRVHALQQEIAALEAENVAMKDWTMMGEASSAARPQNSLLEEDLDFERAVKPVPLVTEEAVQTLENRIKARILEGDFDDVIRRKPMDDRAFLSSRGFELSDKRSAQSLSQIYEDEYVRVQNGSALGTEKDAKLQTEHDEIEKMWANICIKLDALSNAHFMPKAPKAIIETISNTASIALESVLPTATSTSTLLAPEEVFTPTAGILRARSELKPAEKRSLRTKERKARKIYQDVLLRRTGPAGKDTKSVKEQKKLALESVVKTGKGVTVIGKRGADSRGKRMEKLRTL